MAGDWMLTLYERIKVRRKELGLSQSELAALLGYKDRSAIAKIESGTNDLTQSKIDEFAIKLETTPQYLMGWTNDPYNYADDPENRLKQIPPSQFQALKDLLCGDLALMWAIWTKESYSKKQLLPIDMEYFAPSKQLLASSRLSNYHVIPVLDCVLRSTSLLSEQNIAGYTLTDLNDGGQYFAIRCKDDTMINARLYHGDIIHVRIQSDVENNDIAAVLVKDEIMLRKVFRSRDKLILEAANPLYDPLVYYGQERNQVKILGKAISFTGTIKPQTRQKLNASISRPLAAREYSGQAIELEQLPDLASEAQKSDTDY